MKLAMNDAREAVRQVPLSQLARLPLLWLSLAFIAGIVLARQVEFHAAAWLLLALFFVGLAILVHRSQAEFFKDLRLGVGRASLFAAAFAAVCLGAARYQLEVPPLSPAHVSFFNDREYDVLVTGWLIQPPDERERYSNLRVRVEAVDTGDGDMPVEGLLLARVGTNRSFSYGQVIRLRGRLQTPPSGEEFSYRDYLARQGIHSLMRAAEATLLPESRGNPFWSALYAVRQVALERVYRFFPDPEASLMAGIVLGVDSGMTDDLREAFQDTGTAHIIAISGFNMTIVAMLTAFIFEQMLGRRRGLAPTLIAMALYTLLVGADPEVVRALFMVGLLLIGRQLGRSGVGVNTLAFSAALLAALNPFVIRDVGFQLSFAATLGIVLWAEPITRTLINVLTRQWAQPAAQGFLRAVAVFIAVMLPAQVWTLPLTAYYFGRVSMTSFPANALISPAQPAVMIVGGLAALSGLFVQPVGQAAALAAWPFALYTVRIVEFFDRVGGAPIHLGRFAGAWLALIFFGLLAITFDGRRTRAAFDLIKARGRPFAFAALLLALFMCSIISWQSAVRMGDGRLHVTFLDVGSGEAVLVRTPSGRHVLINGGENASMLSDQLGRRLPVLRRELDWLVVAATGEEHLSASPRVLDRYRPQQALWSGTLQASFAARELDKWLADKSIPVTYAEARQTLDLGDGARLEVIAEGTRGSVLALRWRGFNLLLPIGLDADMLTAFENDRELGPVDALLLADSGYESSNSPEWINSLAPRLIVLSVAAGDDEGRPDRDLLAALEDYQLLRTDRNGWVSLATDGESLALEVEKQ